MPRLERYESQTLTKKAGLAINMASPFHFLPRYRSLISILQVLRAEWQIVRDRVIYNQSMENKQKAKEIVLKLKKLFPNPKTPLNYSNPWELYIAVALSAQQTDVGVNKVTETLFKKYKSLKDYSDVSLDEFEKDIRSINFYKGKAKAIKKAADIVSSEYKDKMPQTMEELLKLPFIGRKTANVILQEAFGRSEGIVVDTHVKRLSNLFGLSKNSDPVKIEKDLMEILPQKDWREFGLGLIYYGRTYCKANCKHTDCLLKEYVSKK